MSERQPQRFADPLPNRFPDDHAIDHGVDVVQLARLQRRDSLQIEHFAVDPDTDQPRFPHGFQGLHVLAPAAPDQRRHDHALGALGKLHQAVVDLLGALLPDRLAALGDRRRRPDGP